MTTAVFSPDRRHRYLLRRRVGSSDQVLVFIMLNPSIADEVRNDPTVTRCMGFARQWGFGWLEVVNIFALRATDPKELKLCDDSVGVDNDQHIREAILRSGRGVCAWGNHGQYLGRSRQVLDMLRPLGKTLLCLGMNKTGEPKHPLYLAAKTELKVME